MTRNTPQYIVIHHSVSPRDQTLEKSVASFNNNHKQRLHPEANSLGLHIAYHYVIAGNGDFQQTRPEDEAGWHASNHWMNTHSIGICLTGNFDEEKPTQEQKDTLIDLLIQIVDAYDIPTENIIAHTDVVGVYKTCCGKHLYGELPNLRMLVGKQELSAWALQAAQWAAYEEIWKNQDRPQDEITSEWVWWVFKNMGFSQHDSPPERMSREQFITFLYRLKNDWNQ